MTNNILPLAKELIAVPSVTGQADEMIDILKLTEKHLEGYHVKPFVSNTIPSLLYSNKGKDTKNFKFILNAHLDVVPGTADQFKPIVKDGKLYGRGSYDTKAGAAAMILLFKELASQVDYPLGLQITTDEEIGGEHGTKYQIDQGVRGEFVIATECGSNFGIIHEAKAWILVKLTSTGKSSHSAYPWLGDNAIWKLQQVIYSILQAYPLPKEPAYQTTVNVSHIKTEKENFAFNRIPDYCEALLDIRCVPAEKEIIIPKLRSMLTEGVTLEVLGTSPAHQTDENNKYVQALHKTVKSIYKQSVPLVKQHATSDARHYSGVGCDGIEFGPIGQNQHTDNEWVDIKSLTTYYDILKQFLTA